MRSWFNVAAVIALAVSGTVGGADNSSGPAVAKRHSLAYTWVNSAMTVGEDIRIYLDGRYESRPWCDICMPKTVAGTWREQDMALVLLPDVPHGTRRVLHIIERGGCHLLTPPGSVGEDGVINPLMVYTRDDEHCEVGFDGHVRKL